jgi:osmotically-inducible protein OsmY
MARMRARKEERSDAAVFADARKHLDDCPTVPSNVYVHVEDGLVTLTGSVPRASQRTDAEHTVRPLIGAATVEQDHGDRGPERRRRGTLRLAGARLRAN